MATKLTLDIAKGPPKAKVPLDEEGGSTLTLLLATYPLDLYVSSALVIQDQWETGEDRCDIWALGFGDLIHDLTHSRLKGCFGSSLWSLGCRFLSGNVEERLWVLAGILFLGGVKPGKESPTQGYHCSCLSLQ